MAAALHLPEYFLARLILCEVESLFCVEVTLLRFITEARVELYPLITYSSTEIRDYS